MRWVVSTLLASSSRVRHCAPQLFGEGGQPQLAEEEYRALAGVWRADLELDDGDMQIPLHLAAPPSSQWGPDGSIRSAPNGAAPAGRVYPMDDKLPWNVLSGGSSGRSTAWWSASRDVPAGAEGDDALRLSMQLGNLYLEGRGQRGDDFRCTSFAGTALEGGDDPCVVGRFNLQMSLPFNADIDTLGERYQQRIAARPTPPLTYRRSSFVDRWRLLLSMDDDSSPAPNGGQKTAHAFFLIELSDNGTWESVGSEQTLAGSWGVSSDCGLMEEEGTGVWLSVQRKGCSETLRGVAGLPVRSDFHLSGKPVIETVEQEMAAREAAGAGQGGMMTAVSAHRVDGRLREGSGEPHYFGSFTLLREYEAATELVAEIESLTNACDKGQEQACTTLSKEDEAKRAWLERLDKPLNDITAAPVPHPAMEASPAAPLPPPTHTSPMHTSPMHASSASEEAKRKWLAHMNAPLWNEPVQPAYPAVPDAAAADAAATSQQVQQACHAGNQMACDQMSREEEAKRAWMARLDAPQWGAPAQAESSEWTGVVQPTDAALADAKRAWLARLDPSTWG